MYTVTYPEIAHVRLDNASIIILSNYFSYILFGLLHVMAEVNFV